jgi:hypothetical protein
MSEWDGVAAVAVCAVIGWAFGCAVALLLVGFGRFVSWMVLL